MRSRLRPAPAVIAAVLSGLATWGTGLHVIARVAVVLLGALVVELQVRSYLSLSRQTRQARDQAIAASRAHAAQLDTHADSRRDAIQATIRDHSAMATRRTVAEVRRGAEKDVAQVEAVIQLVDLLKPASMLPRTRGWAASPDVLALLMEEVRQRRPRTIVDLGSGASTLVMALTCERFGIDARIVSIDHEPAFAAKTQETLAEFGVTSFVEVRLAPITDVRVDDQMVPWYDVAAFDDLHDVDLVFVDGPPGALAPMSRHPALPVLLPRLSAQALLVVDDADRDDERTMIERWKLTAGVETEHRDLEKGAVLVKVTRDP
jgi:predicted O-methyltransferase YrrM